MNPADSPYLRAPKNCINRRSFLNRSLFCTTTGMSLLALAGTLSGTTAAEKGGSKEEIFGKLDREIERLYPILHTCSQPTLAALNDQFGLDADQTVTAIRLFAGGIAGKGETCGAVTGSLLALGFFFDVKKANSGPAAGASMTHAGAFFDRFTREFGSIRCREVMTHQYGKAIDYGSPEDLKLLAKPENQGKCLEVMKTAVHIAAEIMLQRS
ncbi:MAG: C_GCAxxG_C_C family protein [Acidobacteria bacterium]|nr:C_GCAxxG_C_C family protein [Acidobacteriota bacterium]